MMTTLALVGGALLVGWAVWWWLLRGHQRDVAALMDRVEKLDQTHEPQ